MFGLYLSVLMDGLVAPGHQQLQKGQGAHITGRFPGQRGNPEQSESCLQLGAA